MDMPRENVVSKLGQPLTTVTVRALGGNRTAEAYITKGERGLLQILLVLYDPASKIEFLDYRPSSPGASNSDVSKLIIEMAESYLQPDNR